MGYIFNIDIIAHRGMLPKTIPTRPPGKPNPNLIIIDSIQDICA